MKWGFWNKTLLSAGVSALVITSMSQISWAMGAKSYSGSGKWSTHLALEEVRISRNNRSVSQFRKSVDCRESFLGTYAGNTIVLNVEAKGPDNNIHKAGLSHHLIYRWDPNSYILSDKMQTDNDISTNNGRFKVVIPMLMDNIAEVDQHFLLTTMDSSGTILAESDLEISVTRSIILTPSRDDDSIAKNCSEIYPASPIGWESNGSSEPSQVEVMHSLQKEVTRTKGWNAGVYFNPTVGVGGIMVSLFGANANYFSQVAKSSSEILGINHSIALPPGDTVDIYEQHTRIITAYDVEHVDVCGNRKLDKGAILLQTWSTSYPTSKYDPGSTEQPSPLSIGKPPSNTCHEELSPERAKSSEGTYSYLHVTGGAK